MPRIVSQPLLSTIPEAGGVILGASFRILAFRFGQAVYQEGLFIGREEE